MAGSPEAFVTLATNDTYAVGALVLGQSLRDVGTTKQLAIMISAGVSQPMRDSLNQVFDLVTEVNVLDSQDRTNLDLLARPDLGITFTKLHCWRLIQYSKAVFMDADTLVVQNIDDLFQRDEFSAAPDPGWPDCFNSGVFVFRPSQDTYNSLLKFAISAGSFDGGDQGLLNLYFSDWATKDIHKHLPFIYNCVSQAFYSYLPAYKRFGKNVRVAHFIGASKPWHQTYNPGTGQVEGSAPEYSQEFLTRWWKLFVAKVQPILATREGSLPEEVQGAIGGAAKVFVPPAPVLPYVPPDISPTYYTTTATTTSSSSSSDAPKPPQQPIELEHRDSFTFLENFYIEPPMASLEAYQAPLETAYEAGTFESTWKPAPTPSPPSVTDQEEEESGRDKVSSSPGGEEEEEGATSLTSPITTSPTSSPTKTSPGDKCSGDVAELMSSIRISSSGHVVSAPDDPERQFAWEQGQIDYLGVDKFENIQKKLDQTMTEPPPPAPKKKTSPFDL